MTLIKPSLQQLRSRRVFPGMFAPGLADHYGAAAAEAVPADLLALLEQADKTQASKKPKA
jgi:hypothetical protein